ncbi:MAG TPA: hypothetical protein VMS93_09550 [Candidatus Saccharimonadales bacterium]|nr:hypothetical protein [Candidatus Saccharimonadales bacterium]
MGLPDAAGRPARALLESALRLRSALRRMDLDAAALAGAECAGHVWALRAGGAAGPEARRWADAAARMLALCHRRVVAEQDRAARELEALGLSQVRAARYTGRPAAPTRVP